MSCGGECDLCVRVECDNTHREHPGLHPCGWVGYRPKHWAEAPCPWCHRQLFSIFEVHHRLGGGCIPSVRRAIERIKR